MQSFSFALIDCPNPKKTRWERERMEHNGNQIRALLGSDKGNTNVNGRAVGFEWISCNMFVHKEVFIQSEGNLNNTLFYYSIVPLAIMYFKLIFDIIKFNFIQLHCCYLFVFINSFNLIWFLNLFTARFFRKKCSVWTAAGQIQGVNAKNTEGSDQKKQCSKIEYLVKVKKHNSSITLTDSAHSIEKTSLNFSKTKGFIFNAKILNITIKVETKSKLNNSQD